MTTIHFRIIETNDADGTVVARFWTDRIGVDMLDPQRGADGEVLLRADGTPARIRTDYSIGVPPALLADPAAPAFAEFILSCAPRPWFELLEQKLDGTAGSVTPLFGASSSLEVAVERELQLRLDAFARERRYDGIVSLCSYATSKKQRFAIEGQHGVDVRDAVWDKSYEIMGAVLSGARAVPTLEEVVAEVAPLITWSTLVQTSAPQEPQA